MIRNPGSPILKINDPTPGKSVLLYLMLHRGILLMSIDPDVIGYPS